uniref:Neurotransmitter-gated ion-channel ligand-binding domain-containing protein n=1 Tax=Acrobeloides nanus TaxID=290746 RepID=A0A914CNZ1_9BILA
MVFLDPDGQVTTEQRLTVTASCPMNLQIFPLDTQTCELDIESYGYYTTEVNYFWRNDSFWENDNNNLATAISFGKFTLPQYSVVGYITTMSEPTPLDQRLIFAVILKRNIGFYLINIIIPAMLIVTISWVSFWLNVGSTPARVALGVTTMLTMTTLMTIMNNSMPKVSYVKKKIDKFSRIVFPLVFITFQIGYWSLMIVLSSQHGNQDYRPFRVSTKDLQFSLKNQNGSPT